MLHQLIFTKLLGEVDYGARGDFSKAGYNVDGIWGWNVHDGDWIYQGGPDSSAVKNDPYFNQWNELNDSKHEWATPVLVDPTETDAWLASVGGYIY